MLTATAVPIRIVRTEMFTYALLGPYNRHMSEHTSRTRASLTVRRFSSSAEADQHDLEYWMQMPESERIMQVWRLSTEQWRLAGYRSHEPGLCRSIARVYRR